MDTMSIKRAAEVLRVIDRDALICEEHDALRMGAEALEFQSWIFGRDSAGYMRLALLYLSPKWHDYPTFEDYCKAEWEKERKG